MILFWVLQQMVLQQAAADIIANDIADTIAGTKADTSAGYLNSLLPSVAEEGSSIYATAATSLFVLPSRRVSRNVWVAAADPQAVKRKSRVSQTELIVFTACGSAHLSRTAICSLFV